MSTILNKLFFTLILVSGLHACGVYSLTGADTGAAKTFSIGFFRSQTPLAGPTFSQQFTEALKDLMQAQSGLKLVSEGGDINLEGLVVDYRLTPVGVVSGETAAQNRLSAVVKVKYTNLPDKEKSFERSFTKFVDYDSSFDLLTVENQLNSELIGQLTQEIFNAGPGNW